MQTRSFPPRATSTFISVPTLVLSVFLIAQLLTAVPLSAMCQDPPCRDPLYYAIFTTQPEYCNYVTGDGLYMRYSGTVIIGWYIVRAGDYSTTPPAGFAPDRWWITVGPYGCIYTPY